MILTYLFIYGMVVTGIIKLLSMTNLLSSRNYVQVM